ncbi:hypothetical protein [Sinorhizobium medicae]|uniref:hypothetical protein n=1 Tax=Sinorhizobium medicae TaxID=110321 RepID=UPI001072BC65|nr:hypothetical protein [Sinorhizobium medicae]
MTDAFREEVESLKAHASGQAAMLRREAIAHANSNSNIKFYSTARYQDLMSDYKADIMKSARIPLRVRAAEEEHGYCFPLISIFKNIDRRVGAQSIARQVASEANRKFGVQASPWLVQNNANKVHDKWAKRGKHGPLSLYFLAIAGPVRIQHEMVWAVDKLLRSS